MEDLVQVSNLASTVAAAWSGCSLAIAEIYRWSRCDGDVSFVSAEAGGKKLRSTVQRSTETGLAVEMRNWMTRQASRESTDGSMNSYSSEGK